MYVRCFAQRSARSQYGRPSCHTCGTQARKNGWRPGRTALVMLLSRIDHVQVAMPAGGEGKARRFYGDALGMTEVPKPSHLAQRGGAWFCAADVTIHLGVDPDFRPAKKAHPALVSSDYESLLQRLEENDVAVKREAALEDGRAHCYVDDPFGNRIELIGE